MDELFRDLRYAARLLAKAPAFTIQCVLMLALGIGVSTTVFSWLQTIVLDPLPGVSKPGEIVALAQTYRGDLRISGLSYPDFREIENLRDVFSGAMASAFAPALMTVDKQTEWAYGRVCSVNTFDLLGVKPEIGRTFLPEEDNGEGGHPVLLISHAIWQRRFGGDPAVIGKSAEINQHQFTIVGVTPPEFQGVSGGFRVDFWAPLSMHQEVLNYGSYSSRTFRWTRPLARLRPGVTFEQAQAALGTLSSRLQQSYPESNRSVDFRVYPLWKSPYGAQADFLPVLRIVLAVGIGLLLIVVVNVANLQLARSIGRSKEIALRLALGAGRARVIRQLLTESLLLALCGGVLGAALSLWAVQLFSLLVPKTNLSFGYDFHPTFETFAFTLAVIALSAVFFGLAPALHSAKTDLQQTLKEGGRGSGEGIRHQWLRGALVVSEMGLALLLLIGAGLCVRGFRKARQIELGFDPRNVLYAQLGLVPNGYTGEQGKIFDRELQQRLGLLPGVIDVGLVNGPPLSGGTTNTAPVDVEGYTASESEGHLAGFMIVSPRYFAAMRVPLLAGRDFTEQDDSGAPNVAIINETMARRYWPGLDPLGRRFRMAVGITDSESFTVVGISKAGKYDSLDEPPTPLVYFPYQQRPLASLFMAVVMRTRGDPALMAASLRQQIHELNPAVEPMDVRTLVDYIQPAFAQVNLAATSLVILGATTLLLASIGLYGVMTYLVARRGHEIGVRMALGAQPCDVLGLVVREGMWLVSLGAGIGLMAALGLMPALASVLYGVNPRDPATFCLVTILLAAVALLACCVPARRAMATDPIIVLRSE